MHIRLHTVEGVKEYDLTNINQLNHYIGMKTIDPAALPELRYMPWVVGALAAAGLAVAAAGRRKALLAWVGAFAACGAAGMADFWYWTWDFGHNIDVEHAIIKIPGTVYQPPILGTKQILNFTASSWPASGGIVLGVAFALAAGAVYVTRRQRAAATGSVSPAARAARVGMDVPRAA
jgi:hypothetical protein